jgi:MFS family permease
MPELKHWESFYVIVGAAAGALIGLQFVVMTLIAERPHERAALAGGALGGAFATPTIVHFCAAFFLSALVTAPWHAITTVAVAWGLTGLIGAIYVVVVAWRMRAQKAYRPDLEDWIFHVLMPLGVYVTLALSALAAPSNEHEALFCLGATALMLVFIGIHNAWDAITYLVRSRAAGKDS